MEHPKCKWLFIWKMVAISQRHQCFYLNNLFGRESATFSLQRGQLQTYLLKNNNKSIKIRTTLFCLQTFKFFFLQNFVQFLVFYHFNKLQLITCISQIYPYTSSIIQAIITCSYWHVCKHVTKNVIFFPFEMKYLRLTIVSINYSQQLYITQRKFSQPMKSKFIFYISLN